MRPTLLQVSGGKFSLSSGAALYFFNRVRCACPGACARLRGYEFVPSALQAQATPVDVGDEVPRAFVGRV